MMLFAVVALLTAACVEPDSVVDSPQPTVNGMTDLGLEMIEPDPSINLPVGDRNTWYAAYEGAANGVYFWAVRWFYPGTIQSAARRLEEDYGAICAPVGGRRVGCRW